VENGVSNTERRKGKNGELEVVAVFTSAGFDCSRTPNSGALRIRGDLHGDLPLHVEVKRQEVARPWLWAEQAATDAGAGARWLVAMRRSRSEWLAMMPLEQAVRLLELERQVLELDGVVVRNGEVVLGAPAEKVQP
jgi:Holliday junction resolvase